MRKPRKKNRDQTGAILSLQLLGPQYLKYGTLKHLDKSKLVPRLNQ